ncbi:hypothetical protein DL768_004829 [Monosporascus sp. mg162]|nr:hypothetical protein DL768_004829 [Monosporascus sp. mg162]
MFLSIPAQLADQDPVADFNEMKVSAASNRGSKKSLNSDYFDDAILSYPNQRDVTLPRLEDNGGITANIDGQVELSKKGVPDPWGWKAEPKDTREVMAVSSASWLKGEFSHRGDFVDITSWTRLSPSQSITTTKTH